MKHEQHSRSTLEIKEEEIATRLLWNEAAKWHQTRHEKEMSHVDTRFKLHSIHSMHSSWKTHESTKIESGPNYTTALHAFIKATLSLGLRAPFVARNNPDDDQLFRYELSEPY